jgi:uncharacterized protein YneF (UPF0154 family)
MELIIGAGIFMVVSIAFGFLLGYKVGSKSTTKTIFKALGVKPGYKITGVSFSKE